MIQQRMPLQAAPGGVTTECLATFNTSSAKTLGIVICCSIEKWRLVVDARRTHKVLETSLLIKLYKKRSMGALISLGEPIDTSKPYQKGILSNFSN